MIERRVLTQGQHGVLKVYTYDGRCLLRELSPCGRRHNGRRQHEPLERAQAYTIRKSHEVEVPKYIPFTPIEPISKTIREERVARKTLCFLNK